MIFALIYLLVRRLVALIEQVRLATYSVTEGYSAAARGEGG